MSILSAEEMVRVHNYMDSDFNFRWGSRDYRVRAGRDGFVPFASAKHYLGDPRTQPTKVKLQIDLNTTEWVPSRQDEIERLNIKYGNHENPTDMTLLKSRMPNVTIHTIDNEELILPVDDPDCTMAMGLRDSDDDRAALMAEIQQMRRRLMTLEGYADTLLPEGEAQAVSPDAPEPGEEHNIRVPDEGAFGSNTDLPDSWTEESPVVVGGVMEDTPIRTPTLRPKARLMPRPLDE